jgi:hypothetical protein
MNRRWLGLWGGVLLGLSSCQSFRAPTPALEPLIQPESHEGRRSKARVRITSDWFNGEFSAVKVERSSPEARVRFQLFPDLGGKVLDLVARPDGVIAHWPHSGEVQRTREALIGFLAVSLMEDATPLHFDRVRGTREVEGGTLLDVAPASFGLDLQVHVLIDSEGVPVQRRYVLDGVGWIEDMRPDHRVHSRKFEWSFVEESVSTLARPKDQLFELRVPGTDGP